jgi:hypothetical protein
MITENKYKLMIWAIVILAVLNLSTLGSLLYHQYKSAGKTVSLESFQKQLEADSEKYSGRYFRDQLNLDMGQMNQFREFNPVFRQHARAITMELGELRKQMLVEMAAKSSDTAWLNSLSDSIGSLHAGLKKLTFNYYLQIKNICNDEQQKKLEKIFAEIFTNDAAMGYPGRGMGRGSMHGRVGN